MARGDANYAFPMYYQPDSKPRNRNYCTTYPIEEEAFAVVNLAQAQNPIGAEELVVAASADGYSAGYYLEYTDGEVTMKSWEKQRNCGTFFRTIENTTFLSAAERWPLALAFLARRGHKVASVLLMLA